MPRKSDVYLGVDPGTANTGIAVVAKGKGGKLKLLHLERIHTEPKQKDRVGFIQNRIKEIVAEFGVSHIFCEAFEVRPWDKSKQQQVAMSKLMNNLSDTFYELGLPWLLSSPANKKGIKLENLPSSVQEQILAMPKTHQEHVEDAYIHVYYQICKRGR